MTPPEGPPVTSLLAHRLTEGEYVVYVPVMPSLAYFQKHGGMAWPVGYVC